jgi:plasmid stabilization system protein ParE
MTLAVVVRRAARHEFDEAALWYEERRPGLGAQFILEIDRAVHLAAENPQRFSARNLGVSSCCQCSMRVAIQMFGSNAHNPHLTGRAKIPRAS